ncbi:MAG: hypothetical protein IPP60_14810 [Sphingobacteriales bacterium]|nr:hypothetical protein [Sphingobacteriales bacterium]
MNWQFIFGSMLLLSCGIKLYYGIQNSMDVQFADEAAYIRFGLDLFETMNRNWGPMYALWYKCLSFITTDTIQLYYLNFMITSVLVGVLLYFFLLRISVKPTFALFISFCVLVSDLNISVWPRISHFCIVLCLIALIIISFLKNNIYKCLVFTIMCLINAYARPEFYLSFVIMVIVTFICIYYNKSVLTRKDIYIFSGIVILIGILHFIFRFPSNDFFGYNRGVAAFYQHYAWNYKMRTNGTFDAWLYWEDLAKKQFGDCNSMWCVIKTQPGIFISNTLFNVRTYLLQLLKVCSYVFPVGIFHGKKMQLLLTLLTIVTFITLLLRKKSRVYFLQKIYSYKFYLLILFCFITPTLLSCMVVFPRDHYLYLQMLFVLLILISAFGFIFEYLSLKPVFFIAFGILLFLATPNVQSYSFMKFSTDTHAMCNKKLIQHLEKKYANTPHTLFTNMPFVRGLLPTTFKEINTIFDKKKSKPFTHYIDSAKIDIVIITPSTLRDPHLTSDSSWINFMNNPANYNFKKEVFCDCDLYLLVKEVPEKN